jgi:3-isopropylmalate/(R)-2-methylmalate dehydratase small subunit
VVTTPYQDRFAFAIDPFRKMCLMQGLDEIGLTLAEGNAISAYETRRGAAEPWLVPTGAV